MGVFAESDSHILRRRRLTSGASKEAAMDGSSVFWRALRSTVALALVLVMGVSEAARAAETGERAIQRRIRLYMQAGAFAGDESPRIYGYDKAPVRIFYEFGLKRMMSEPRPGHLDYLALGMTLAIGLGGDKTDVRFAFGPTGAWRVSRSWTVNAMAGPLRSNRAREFDLGVQARFFACYKNGFSLDYLSQYLPVDEQYGMNAGVWESSQYMGVVFHGNLGVAMGVAFVVLAALAALALFIALSNGPAWQM
jgi:hypothetical protein